MIKSACLTKFSRSFVVLFTLVCTMPLFVTPKAAAKEPRLSNDEQIAALGSSNFYVATPSFESPSSRFDSSVADNQFGFLFSSSEDDSFSPDSEKLNSWISMSVSNETLQIDYCGNASFESAFRSLNTAQRQKLANITSVIIDIKAPKESVTDDIAEGSNWDVIFNFNDYMPKVNHLTISGLTEVPSYALYRTIDGLSEGPQWLKSLSLPDTIQIGAFAFTNSPSLEKVDLPSVKAIESFAFYANGALAQIKMPQVRVINESAFEATSSLVDIQFPMLTKLGIRAFAEASSLKSVHLPKARTISESAFFKAEKLENIDISSVVSIEDFAFDSANALQKITLPGSLEFIGKEAFKNTLSLQSITFAKYNASLKISTAGNGLFYDSFGNKTRNQVQILVPHGYENFYASLFTPNHISSATQINPQ